MRAFLRAGVLAPYKILLQRVLRFKPHTLGRKEEHLLAMQTEMAQAARQVFQQLNDADLKFGDDQQRPGPVDRAEPRARSARCCTRPSGASAGPPSINTIASTPTHQHTLAAALGGSIQRDVYYARARRLPQRPGGGPVPRPACRCRSTTT